MTRRRLLLVAAIVAVAAAFAYYRCAPREVPAGQPPLATLDATALDTVRAEFNRAAGQVRIIVLLSPT